MPEENTCCKHNDLAVSGLEDRDRMTEYPLFLLCVLAQVVRMLSLCRGRLFSSLEKRKKERTKAEVDISAVNELSGSGGCLLEDNYFLIVKDCGS